MGDTSYPDLQSVPEKIDVVQVFRKPEDVPPVVDDAIKAGAKVIWMQEGIVHEEAAQKARQAGLQVVMDTCMRVAHRTLIGTTAHQVVKVRTGGRNTSRLFLFQRASAVQDHRARITPMGQASRPCGGKPFQNILIHEVGRLEIPSAPIQVFIEDPSTIFQV